MNIGYFILVYCLAYFITTLVGIAHTLFNWKVLKMENKVEKITTMYDVVAYAKTVPFHPLYNIIIWPVLSYFYLRMVNPVNLWQNAFVLGAVWTIITIVIDLFGWVIIKHPWRMTYKEMYVDYQPWISLIYLSIFISPLIAAVFIR